MILSTQNVYLLGDLASEKNLCTNSLRINNCFGPEELPLFLVVFRASLGQKLGGVVNLGSETPENHNVTKVNLISLVLNAEKIKEIGWPQSFGTVRFSLTMTLNVQKKLLFSTLLTRNEAKELPMSRKTVWDAISRSNWICPKNMLFLTDHNVS